MKQFGIRKTLVSAGLIVSMALPTAAHGIIAGISSGNGWMIGGGVSAWISGGMNSSKGKGEAALGILIGIAGIALDEDEPIDPRVKKIGVGDVRLSCRRINIEQAAEMVREIALYDEYLDGALAEYSIQKAMRDQKLDCLNERDAVQIKRAERDFFSKVSHEETQRLWLAAEVSARESTLEEREEFSFSPVALAYVYQRQIGKPLCTSLQDFLPKKEER